MQLVQVRPEHPDHVAVLFRCNGELFALRIRALDDSGAPDPLKGAVDVIDANIEELIDTGALQRAGEADAASIRWFS